MFGFGGSLNGNKPHLWLWSQRRSTALQMKLVLVETQTEVAAATKKKNFKKGLLVVPRGPKSDSGIHLYAPKSHQRFLS